MNLGYVILGYGGTALAVLCGGLAAWRGGWPERLAVTCVIFGWFATPFIQTTYAPGLPIIILDAGEVMALYAISLCSRRLWSAMITACVAADLVSQIVDVVAPHDPNTAWAYVVTVDFLGGIFVALCFAYAAWESESHKRLARRAR